jgi:hypothetical protein
MFAAVGSSSDMACRVMRGVLIRASSDDMVARRNSPTLALPSGRGLVVGCGCYRARRSMVWVARGNIWRG